MPTCAMRRNLCRSILLVVLLSPLRGAFARDGKTTETENNRTTVYIRDEQVTQFGIRNGASRELVRGHTVWIDDVTNQEDVIVDRLRGVARVGLADKDGKLRMGDYGEILRSEERFRLQHGMLPFLELPLHDLFSADFPYAGFEYFYLPVRQEEIEKILPDVDRIVPLVTYESFSPTLKGAWTYRCHVASGRATFSGVYFLESADQHISISGSMEKNVTLRPFQLTRMSGEIACRLRPASTLFPPGPVSKVGKELIEDLDEVIVHLKYRLVPIDSDEAKSITIPAKLASAPIKSPKSH